LSSAAESEPDRQTTAEDAYAAAAQAGIHRMAIPTPFAVGRVNLYLIEDRPLTLIDAGPNSGKSLDVLERDLASLGHRLEDIELVVITHQHLDHVGLLEIIVGRSGADVAAWHLLGPYLEDFAGSAAADDEFAQAIMKRHGVPHDTWVALGSAVAAFRAFGSSAKVARPLRDGDLVELEGRTLRALHRPGHSPSDTIFSDDDRQIVFSGDHLIGHISSNPLVTRPLEAGSEAPRPQALVGYIASLRATQELPARLVLPGHGDPVTDHVALIDQRLQMHRRRAGKILRILDEGPMTAYEIATRIWGDVPLTQAYLMVSEVLGHVDLLLNDGAVVEREDGDVVRFETAAPPP
jgi:glyoxylase-like metal-dependent hydrolase (beta-lactamase superfamily II)